MRAVLVVAHFCVAVAAPAAPRSSRPSRRIPPLADSADQVMYGARFNLTDKGLQRAQLDADTAYFFDDNTRIELEPVHTTFFTATGAKDAVLTSSAAPTTAAPAT